MSSDKELVIWLALVRLFNARPRLGHGLIEKSKGITEILNSSPPLMEFDDWDGCKRDLDKCNEFGVEIITYNDERYPPLLRMIADPPLVLFVRGDPAVLSTKPCLAVIGARKATRNGLDRAFEIAKGAAAMGITVVSGMAYGIDSAAHAGALKGRGQTIAVWGAGPDIIYPRAHRPLAERIFEQGAAITEFPPGTKPAPYNFPQRNRIISGLSLGVVVVEAAESSGSLITVDFALDQGREVYAMPGGAGLVANRGSHKLLRDGAVLVETAEDVVETLFKVDVGMQEIKKTGQAKKVSATDSRHEVELPHPAQYNDDPLLKFLEVGEGVSLDQIIQESGIQAAEVLKRLTHFELEGAVEELPGKRYRIAR